MEIVIPLNVAPLGSPRPRLTKFGKAYYPEHYRRYRELLTEEFEKANLPKLLDVYRIEMLFFFSYPKSTPKKHLVALAPYRKKPDYDNTAKTITDVLQDIGVIKDDSMISEALLKKFYTLDNPRMLVKLITL
jgi:Holliday junction resolvase RusA-like endonuclease